jgi:hypothetical protein
VCCRARLAVRGEHRHPQVHRCSTQPSEKPLGRRLFCNQSHVLVRAQTSLIRRRPHDRCCCSTALRCSDTPYTPDPLRNPERASGCRKHPLALDHRASTRETRHNLLNTTRPIGCSQRAPPPGTLLQRHAATGAGTVVGLPDAPYCSRRQSQSPRPPGRNSHVAGHRAGPAARHSG